MNLDVPQLHFGPEFEKDELMLFEIPDEDTLGKILSGHIPLEIVAHEEDPIVVCTKDKTFQLLEFDTSNTLLLHEGPDIYSKQTSTFELRHISPPFLQFCVELNRYPATEAEIFGQAALFNPLSLEFLRDNTLCSCEEFDSMLIDVCAFSIGDFVKVPTPELRITVSDSIIRYSQTQKEWKCINISDMLEEMRVPRLEGAPYRNNVILAVLHSLCSDFSDEIAHLDESKIVKHFGTEILSAADDQILTKDQFEEQMVAALPIGLKMNLRQLYGIFVSNGELIRYVDDSSLPVEVGERFKACFSIQTEWNTHEIEPFFKYFVGDDISFNELATLHARLVDDLWMPR